MSRFAALGIPALNYGPGDPNLAHTREEHVRIHQITACTECCVATSAADRRLGGLFGRVARCGSHPDRRELFRYRAQPASVAGGQCAGMSHRQPTHHTVSGRGDAGQRVGRPGIAEAYRVEQGPKGDSRLAAASAPRPASRAALIAPGPSRRAAAVHALASPSSGANNTDLCRAGIPRGQASGLRPRVPSS